MTEAELAEADKLIEDGLALVAKGMFRIGDTLGEPMTAFERGMSVVRVVREMAFDFNRRATKT